MEKNIHYRPEDLTQYIVRFLTKYGVPEPHARQVAGVIVEADLRGVHSHGISRLHVYYGDRLRAGLLDPSTPYKVLHETETTVRFDGANGFGQVVGIAAMEKCIEKAKTHHVGIATVCNSNHYGIAAYYSMMALPHGMIGVSLTNSQPLVAPTYGRERVLGTNPISVAAPAKKYRPYVLDMATSIVPMGKIMLAETKGETVPLGYGINAEGKLTQNPSEIRNGGALLPLGGPDYLSGYKGYSLALLVDILCGVLAGAAFGKDVGSPAATTGGPTDIGHFFLAIDIQAFRPLEDFTKDMDRLIEQLVTCPKELGKDRIFIHGEKEFEQKEYYLKHGIALPEAVVEVLRKKGKETGVPFDLSPLST